MDTWAKGTPGDREALFTETASRKGVSPEIVEKDFWVCWILLQISRFSEFPRLIFKGGTSLSKVYGIIKRFSEDIDLVINRHELGFDGDKDPANQEGTNVRNRTIEQLKATCFDVIRNRFVPKLKTQISSVIGDNSWSLEIDPDAPDPDTVIFEYPIGIPSTSVPNYIRRAVRVELGCRGEQIPCEEGLVTPYAAEVKPELFKIPSAPVMVISAERTFWEKITILHREYYRLESGKSISERVFRHYHDVVLTAEHERGKSALTKNFHLLDEVVAHKQHFFREAGAHYELAKKGTVRLAPGKTLKEGLRKDYEGMKEMYFGEEPDFDEVMKAVPGAQMRCSLGDF